MRSVHSFVYYVAQSRKHECMREIFDSYFFARSNVFDVQFVHVFFNWYAIKFMLYNIESKKKIEKLKITEKLCQESMHLQTEKKTPLDSHFCFAYRKWEGTEFAICWGGKSAFRVDYLAQSQLMMNFLLNSFFLDCFNKVHIATVMYSSYLHSMCQ